MDPLTAIAIAKGLATFVPSLMKMFGAKEPTVDVATKVIDIATAVTGAKTPEEALAVINANTEKQIEFQKAIMDNETSLQKMYLADVQDARARDVELAKAGQYNVRANVLVAIAFVLVIACMVATVFLVELPEYAKVSLSLILGRSLGWVDQVMNFDFGTTRANAKKDDTINNLTK